MPRYSAPFTKTNSDSVRQLVEILSSATVQRQKWFAFVVGCVTTPADAVFKYVVRRVTASATGTALTPTPLDPTNDAACRSTAEHVITADHSSFNSSPLELFRAPCNHRATYQWMAGDGRELIGPAVSGNGLSLGMADASALLFEGTAQFEE